MSQLLRADSKYTGVYYHGEIELWTTSRCAAQLNYTSTFAVSVVDKTMRRRGFKPYTRLPGRTGENLWRATQVSTLRPAATQ